LISELARDSEPDKDLMNEDLSAKPEAIFQVAVSVVEQARRLELQITFPEFTFATMLPIVIAIEPVSVLKTEFLSRRLEAEAIEPLSDLMKEAFSARPEAKLTELLSDLMKEDLSATPEAKVTELLSDLNNDFFSVDANVRELLRPWA